MARKKKGGGHGGHGWFVTFADLMALLMSFFVVVAAFSSQDKQKLQVVAGSMREAFGTQREFRAEGLVEKNGIPTRAYANNVRMAPPEEGTDTPSPSTSSKTDGTSIASFDRAFSLAAASLRQALGELPEFAELSKNVIVEETREGLNISLVDQDGRAMFADGATQPFERTRMLLERMAPQLRRMPNRVSVTGHTSASRPGTRAGWSGWDLSAGRAAAVREILATNGLPDDRFAGIAGKADSDPLFPDDPYLAANRRVTITLLREAPPIPFGAKP